MLNVDITLNYKDFALNIAQSFPASGVTALFGRSGSGKSTLLRVIAGLELNATGRIAWGDDVWQDARHRTPPHKRGLGYVFQDTRLFPHLTVAQNLSYADKRAQNHPGPSMDDVITALDLAPLLPRHPATLSGGEQSRCAIGRALLTRPRMLLMDEPLAALDATRKAEILPYLERLRDNIGTPILYVSHQMAEVTRLANHLMLIDKGQITHAGPLETLLADPATAPALGARDVGAVITATLTAQDSDGLSRLTCATGPIYLPHIDAPLGARLRIRILAQDVIIARTAPTGLSALNILPATVTSLHPDGASTLVQLHAGTDQILARITTRSATALALAPGTPCFAILKTAAVAPAHIGDQPNLVPHTKL
ncbi:molybdate transport system ATP-binding protein [Pseudorhodobacter antarcticus]|jgi:molybdate transport system ATP-binding protein|uniref:Molybdate transport system ATP-binding protein n=1 Tax=Pseudorhodobacter antarcticus TaxID=1077947 RepID=A0A1H8D507_9RHOB|nr:molybdenum ABC transporter ATP-binding protein [Pseudorhodobacter antarcticus]SEN02265.1 molybdate transport system ATP-binding protein [Pseudorhodobacter antarcticus]